MQNNSVQNGNAFIKALWVIYGLKSSDFIRFSTARTGLTASRIRGLMSAPSNANFRPAQTSDIKLFCRLIDGCLDEEIEKLSENDLFQLVLLATAVAEKCRAGHIGSNSALEMLRDFRKTRTM